MILYKWLQVLTIIVIVFSSKTLQYSYDIKHIEVPVDHFSFASNTTFHIRYLVNDTFWNKETGPIFFYTGNEGDIKMFAENSGFMWDIAPEFKAMLIFAEHRYYGESLPFGNASFSNAAKMGYLTAHQALEDYVSLITFLREKAKQQGRTNFLPVIAFGGSYGGMLTAWFRMKYPNIVQGGLAASAPIFQFEGLVKCKSFYRILSSDFYTVSEECAKSIRASWDAINNNTATDGGKAWLSSSWKLCKPLTSTTDVQKLKDWLVDIYTNFGMLDYPYPTNFLTPLPAYPIVEMCQFLNSSTVPPKELLGRIFRAISVYFNYTGSVSCLDINSEAQPSLGADVWNFQACTEMVMPMCTDGENDIFEPMPWDLEKYKRDCRSKFWGIEPQPQLVPLRYGGQDLATASTNIIFSNGLRDPWAGGGVLRNLSDTVVAVIIPEGAHHLDLRGRHANDPVSVTAARKFYRQEIAKWIQPDSE